MRKLSRTHYILICIFIIALVLRLFTLETTYFFWDETIYIMNSRFLATGKSPYVQLSERPILLSILIMPFYKSELMMRVSMILLNSIAVFAIYFLAKNLDKKTALISALLTAIFPFHIMSSKWVMTDTLSFIFITLTIGFYLAAAKKDSLIYYSVAGFFLGASMLLKFTNLLMIPLLIVLFFLMKIDYKKLSLSFVVMLITISPYIIFNKLYFGSFFHPILKATHVITEHEPISLIVVSYQLMMFFGLLLFFSAAEIFFGEKNKISYFMIFWLIYGLVYFLLLTQKGIAKLPGIEWEMQRFIFPALIPSIVLSARFLSRLKINLFLIFVTLLLISFIPSYTIAFTPTIKFENGLRYISKDIGMFINNHLEKNAELFAAKNFPVIAYYADRETTNKIDELKITKVYLVKIEKNESKFEGETIYHAEKGEYIGKIIAFSEP